MRASAITWKVQRKRDCMKQPYFILVLAHSMHGRLRRVHVPYKILYATLALALFGLFSMAGIVTSYVRMAWKVGNYNMLREEADNLRKRYQVLQKKSETQSEQRASLQILANEVTQAYGIKAKLEGPGSIVSEGRLVPSYRETLDTYNSLRNANLGRGFRKVAHTWQVNIQPSIWPVQSRLVSSFGFRSDPFTGGDSFHAGVDIQANIGTRVQAAADGIVEFTDWQSTFGKLVIVDHGNGLKTYYAHLSSFDVIPGQEVRRGQIVARSGTTGRSQGPHLHYEVHQGGAPVNPYKYLSKSIVSPVVKKDLPF